MRRKVAHAVDIHSSTNLFSSFRNVKIHLIKQKLHQLWYPHPNVECISLTRNHTTHHTVVQPHNQINHTWKMVSFSVMPTKSRWWTSESSRWIMSSLACSARICREQSARGCFVLFHGMRIWLDKEVLSKFAWFLFLAMNTASRQGFSGCRPWEELTSTSNLFFGSLLKWSVASRSLASLSSGVYDCGNEKSAQSEFTERFYIPTSAQASANTFIFYSLFGLNFLPEQCGLARQPATQSQKTRRSERRGRY